VKQAELDAGLRSDGLTTAEREELRRLRRENRILREEWEIGTLPMKSVGLLGGTS
jgi:transposase